jgi:hypothetical protein
MDGPYNRNVNRNAPNKGRKIKPTPDPMQVDDVNRAILFRNWGRFVKTQPAEV